MTNKKEKPQAQGGAQSAPKAEYQLPMKAGGIYFHSGVIIGKKNVFVTHEYLDMMANALKMAELKCDIKNLAYCIMPNFFYWVFQLSERQSNPLPIIGDVKKKAALEIISGLRKEMKDKPSELIDLFKSNDRVHRSVPEKILWTFEMYARQLKVKGDQHYKVWAPHTGTQLLENDEALQQKLTMIKHAPVSERWNLVAKADNYPYLYLSEDLPAPKEEVAQESVVVQAVRQAMAMPIA